MIGLRREKSHARTAHALSPEGDCISNVVIVGSRYLSVGNENWHISVGGREDEALGGRRGRRGRRRTLQPETEKRKKGKLSECCPFFLSDPRPWKF
jgi:hypothetical protein